MYSSRSAAFAVAARAGQATVVWLLLAAVASAPAAAQQGSRISPIPDETRSPTTAGGEGEASWDRLGLYVYTLRHQPAAEALRMIRPLLSSRGTVEVQAGRNTLQVRDNVAVLSRILPLLRSFDRPGLEIEVSIVRASSGAGLNRFRPAVGSPLPPALERDLRELTNFTHFDIVAEASLASREGEQVTYELGERYSVVFRPGRVALSAGRQVVELLGFQVLSGQRSANEGPRVLIHTDLPLILERTKALGLASSEKSSSALMVLLRCRQTGGSVTEPSAGGE